MLRIGSSARVLSTACSESRYSLVLEFTSWACPRRIACCEGVREQAVISDHLMLGIGRERKPRHPTCIGYGVPKGSRTPVTGVKGQCPRPLDDGDRSLPGIRLRVPHAKWSAKSTVLSLLCQGLAQPIFHFWRLTIQRISCCSGQHRKRPRFQTTARPLAPLRIAADVWVYRPDSLARNRIPVAEEKPAGSRSRHLRQ